MRRFTTRRLQRSKPRKQGRKNESQERKEERKKGGGALVDATLHSAPRRTDVAIRLALGARARTFGARSPTDAPPRLSLRRPNATARLQPCFLGLGCWRGSPAAACPSPARCAQAGHRAGRTVSGAAWERGNEPRPQAPHPLRHSAVTGDVPLRERDVAASSAKVCAMSKDSFGCGFVSINQGIARSSFSRRDRPYPHSQKRFASPLLRLIRRSMPWIGSKSCRDVVAEFRHLSIPATCSSAICDHLAPLRSLTERRSDCSGGAIQVTLVQFFAYWAARPPA
jgi:hypothetical protein